MPPLGATCHVIPKKEAEVIILTRFFCPDKIAGLKWGTVGTTPKRTRGKPPWPHKALLRWTRDTSYPLFGPGSYRPQQDP